jgi:hypothetical protein
MEGGVHIEGTLTNWCVIINGAIFFMESQLSREHIPGINAMDISSFELSKKPLSIILNMNNGNSITMKVIDQLDAWMKALSELRNSYYDFFGRLGVTLEKDLDEKVSLIKEEQEMPCTLAYNESLVEKNNQKILLCVHGRNRLTVQISPCSGEFLKSDCSFVLDTGNKIYAWHGINSSRVR